MTGISRSPRTSFNRGLRPTIGAGLTREPFARIVGDVRLGPNATVGRRTSIRADEGAPIAIGANAEIEDRVTFHALSGTSIVIGDRLDTDDNVVFHGPLTVGDDLTIGDDAILFRAIVGNGVTIGDSAIIAGPADAPIQLADGTVVPPDAVITSQAQADALRLNVGGRGRDADRGGRRSNGRRLRPDDHRRAAAHVGSRGAGHRRCACESSRRSWPGRARIPRRRGMPSRRRTAALGSGRSCHSRKAMITGP